MTIWSLIFGFFLMVYYMVKHRNNPFLVCMEHWMQENVLKYSVQSSLKSHPVEKFWVLENYLGDQCSYISATPAPLFEIYIPID